MPEYDSTIEYRDIPGLPYHKAGSDGSIWTCRTRYGNITTSWILLKGFLGSSGYRVISVKRNGVSRQTYIHVLVLVTFLGTRPKGMWGLHGVNGKTDNSIANLRWGTPAENKADELRDGTRVRGSDCTNAKIDEKTVKLIREYADAGESRASIAARLNITERTIKSVRAKKTWAWVE